MIKRLFAIAFATLLISSLFAVETFAGALNQAGGCTTETIVKRAAPGTVVHDGVISPGEYCEIEVNRDPNTTDLLLSWDGSGQTFTNACDFLQNVHFYASWDDNGVNLAAQATLLEDPHCEGTFPTEFTEFNGMTFPGDEFFMFQFGCIFKIEVPEEGIDGAVLYRAIGINTETGEQLYGWYWDHGRTGSLNQNPGDDYFVKVDGRTVTYEMTLPHESVFRTNELNGSLPIDGTDFYFTISLTGGSKGYAHSDNDTYAVSLGDGGYMTVARAITDFSGARGTISNDPVVEEDVPVPTDTEETTVPVATDEPGDTTAGPGESTPPEETQDPYESEGPVSSGEPGDTDDVSGTEDPAQSTGENPADPTDTAENPGTGTDTPRGGTGSPKTGDPVMIISVLSAIGAAGAVVIKRRKF